MKKILLSIFLAVCMLLTNISVIAEESNSAKYQDAIEFLHSLNILTVVDYNDDFSADTYVTREEFCVYLARAFKLEVPETTKQIFSDVPAESGLAPYVNALYERGIVSGYGGAFRPRDIITYNEAIKLLVATLNYDYASEVGGYPEGYLRIASSLEITEGVYATVNLTKGAATQLIYNAMAAPYMEVAKIKGTEITFKSNGDKSVLTELYNIYEGEGVVLANGRAALASGADSIELDEVLIGDTFYKVGKTDVANLLGHYVEFYFLETENDEYEIVMILEDKGEELVISSTQNIRFDGDSYRYEDTDGRTKKVRLDDDYYVMYNFDYPVSGFDSTMMEPDMGRIKLVKSGKGSGYTAVIIEEYVNYVVAGVDTDKQIIYTKERTPIELRTKEIEIFNSEGNVMELSQIKEWNIVSVLTSSDGEKVSIYVSDEAVEGKVNRIKNGDNPKVTIESTEYNVDSAVISKIGFGKVAKFYLDYNGNIAGVDEKFVDGLRYAYLIKASIDYEYDPESDGRVMVKLFDEDGTQKKYHIAEKVRINDVLYKEDPEGIINNGLSVSVNLLKYQLNSDGEINTLYVYDATTDKYIHKLHEGNAYWNLKQRSFGGKVTMETEVPVFVIPEGYGPEDYQVVGLSSFENDKSAAVKVYTMGDNVYGDVILRDTISTKYSRPLALVKEVTSVLDEYGDICYKVTLLYNGSEQEFALAKEDVLGDVDVGDIVKISLNHKNNIQAFLHVYDSSEQTFIPTTNPYEPQSGAGFRSQDRMFYGYAYDITDGLMKYCKTLPVGNSTPITENALLSGFRIYVIDGPELYIGNENDIKDYTDAGNSCSSVIVHTMWGDPEDIVVIKD